MSDLPPTNDPGDADLPADVAGEPTSEKTGTTGEPGRPDAPIGRRSFDHWFGEKDRNGFIHRSWMRAQGFSEEVFDGRPVIGICNTWSELTPCNAHLRRLADSVKRGVWQAGGFPLEFPVMSLGETMLRPTAMLFRNLLSMDVEESLRGNPIDGAILLTGCDKTTPGSIMGAASVDLPTLVVTGGPMLNGKFRGCDIGSGTAVWRFTQDRNAGRMSEADYAAAESGMSRSNGHCMTMGTASTMACMAEALGLQLTGSAAIPAVDSRRYSIAQQAGQRIVKMVEEDLKPSDILTRDAFANAVRANAAIGGSTNAVIHLLAIAGRVGVDLTLDDMDEWARGVPWLVDLQPSGKYLMEDFYYAGGLPAVMKEILPLLKADAITVTGKTMGENVATAERTDWSGQEGQAGDRRHPAGRQPTGQWCGNRRTEGESGAGWCRDQAVGGVRAAAAAPRQGTGVQQHRGVRQGGRRSGARRRRGHCARAAELRSARLPGHAGGREHDDPAQARRDRRRRHGADLGRADERYGVRHRRTACHAGSGCRWAVGAGADG